MFKYSHKFLEQLSGEKIDYKTFNENWLYYQGFEISAVEKIKGDAVVEIEVKANRPDMLNHTGVLREWDVMQGRKQVRYLTSKLPKCKTPIKKEIKVASKDVNALYMLSVEGLNNKGKTPKEIAQVLENLGVAVINPVVDISNYILLAMGQPIHIYDADKVENLVFANAKAGEKITTLHGDKVDLPEGAIVIRSGKSVACLAGMVGSGSVEVDVNTKNILIEAAHFNPVRVRVTSQKTKISTLASYRFERGVDCNQAKTAAYLCAEKIIELCGGKVTGSFEHEAPVKVKEIKVNVKEANSLIGTKLTLAQMKALLEKYYYKVKVQGSNLICVAPGYRVDVEREVDVIADIAALYGYHNIEPTLPQVVVPAVKNVLWERMKELRELMVGFGLNECISYAFIPDVSNEQLGITESKVLIQNPLSNKYNLMRPNLLFSMLSTAIFNMALNGDCPPLFELGSVYKKDKTTDTGYRQTTNLSVLLNGVKIEKGFGISQDVLYDFYDIKQIAESVAREYSANIEFKPNKREYFNQCVDIYLNNNYAGEMGVVSSEKIKKLENGKLMRGDVLYLEIDISKITEGRAYIQPSALLKFQGMSREYNLLVPNACKYSEYEKEISTTAKPPVLITNIEVKDLYNGKGVPAGFTSVLISINYDGLDKTLEAAEVEAVESAWLAKLNKSFNIELKK